MLAPWNHAAPALALTRITYGAVRATSGPGVRVGGYAAPGALSRASSCERLPITASNGGGWPKIIPPIAW
jgi:hypothetical protein